MFSPGRQQVSQQWLLLTNLFSTGRRWLLLTNLFSPCRWWLLLTNLFSTLLPTTLLWASGPQRWLLFANLISTGGIVMFYYNYRNLTILCLCSRPYRLRILKCSGEIIKLLMVHVCEVCDNLKGIPRCPVLKVLMALKPCGYKIKTKGSTQEMYKYSLYNSTTLIKPNS